MKFSDVSRMDDKIRIFVKFGKSQHIKRLLNGKMYFSNAAKFRETEKKNGLKGQGDAFEAILQLKNGNVTMTDYCSGLSFGHPNINMSLGFADTDNIPVFCITCISSEDCSIRETQGRRILIVNSTIRDTIKSHFPEADTAGVFFYPKRFIDSLSGLGIVTYDKVKYFNFSPKGVIKEMIEYISQCPGSVSKRNQCLASMVEEANNGEKKQFIVTEQNMKRILFCKDTYFAGERECRILLPQKRISDPKEYTIRWGGQLRQMYPIDEFFNGIKLE